MFRVGEIAISPGELPPLKGATRARVSFNPSIIGKPPMEKLAVTPWEASTRSVRPLGGLYPLDPYPPQETKFTPAHNKATKTRKRLFKRKAPNDMKKEDLIAKWWIITDLALRLRRTPTIRGAQFELLP
jgi:hypothetical protein